MMSRSMFLFWCAFLWCTKCSASDISYLERERGSILEKDLAAIFNKVAYGGVTTTKRSISSKYVPVSATGSAPTTIAPPLTSIVVPTTPNATAPSRTRQDLSARERQNVEFTTNLPPFLAPKTSFPVAYTTPSTRGDVPSYVPPVRSFFTPPLPPEYANPFADKPTLRGSNSDGTLGPARRPVPLPRVEQEVYARERIPLRPPDLGPEVNVNQGLSTADRKKPLNTPSFHRPPDLPPYDPVDPSPAPKLNDTDFDFVPVVHYPSVSRILSGSNGRKDFPDIHKPRVETRLPPSRPPPPLPSSSPPPAPPPTTTSTSTSPPPPPAPVGLDIQSKVVEDEAPAVRGPAEVEAPRSKAPDGAWLLAWDVHVYLIATLFLLLAICSLFNLVRLNAHRRLLPRGYYLTVHSLLLVIGLLRSLYLFLDAYNSRLLLPRPLSDLALNIVTPLIAATLLVLFLFLLRASKADVLTSRLQQPALLAGFVACHLLTTAALELTAELGPELDVLPIVNQGVNVVVLVVIGCTYCYAYASLSRSAATSVAVTTRAVLAAALTSLLTAAILLYGIFWVPHQPSASAQRWLWWGHQFSVRLTELAACFLMLHAAVQSGCHADQEKAGGMFRCGQCHSGTNSETNDDIYPAVCVTNQAIHDYTLRTGKKVYDDAFPLATLQRPGRYDQPFDVGDYVSRGIRRSGTLAELEAARGSLARNAPGPGVAYRGGVQTLNARTASPSMLVAENGFVRFRALQEPEELDSDDCLMER